MVSFVDLKLRGGSVVRSNVQRHKQADGKIKAIKILDIMTYQSEYQNPQADLCSRMSNGTDLAF